MFHITKFIEIRIKASKIIKNHQTNKQAKPNKLTKQNNQTNKQKQNTNK